MRREVSDKAIQPARPPSGLAGFVHLVDATQRRVSRPLVRSRLVALLDLFLAEAMPDPRDPLLDDSVLHRTLLVDVQ